MEKKKKKNPILVQVRWDWNIGSNDNSLICSWIGCRCAILEGDSLVLINALKIEVHSLALLGLLIEDVKVLSHNFDKLLYSHTKRNNNFVAHSLAKYTKCILYFLVCMEDVPPHPISVLQFDLVDLP